VFAEIESERANFDTLTDFPISFVDRQDLKRVEDRVTELRIVLQTMQGSIREICAYVRRVSVREQLLDDSTMCAIIENLEENVKRVDAYQRLGECLNVRVMSVTKIVRSP
jgi:hypothetical protein